MDQSEPIRVFGLYRIKSNALRRLVIVLTLPLLAVVNVGLMLLAVALFGWKNQVELVKSAAHYWNSSERLGAQSTPQPTDRASDQS